MFFHQGYIQWSVEVEIKRFLSKSLERGCSFIRGSSAFIFVFSMAVQAMTLNSCTCLCAVDPGQLVSPQQKGCRCRCPASPQRVVSLFRWPPVTRIFASWPPMTWWPSCRKTPSSWMTTVRERLNHWFNLVKLKNVVVFNVTNMIIFVNAFIY